MFFQTQKLKSEVKDSEIDRLNDQLEQAAQELRAQKPSAVEPQKTPQDWNDRLRDLKRRLEAEFRARFKEYSLQRVSLLGDFFLPCAACYIVHALNRDVTLSLQCVS